MAEPVRDVEAAAPGAPPRQQSRAGAPRERNRPRPRKGNPARALAHAVLVVLAFAPLALLVFRFVTDDLGGEPIDAFEKETGTWALRFLAASLAVTPLRTLARWSWLAPYRRTLGLVTFAYATVHLLAYAVLDMVVDLGDIGADIVKHPYVTFGMASWLLLLPLALTSTVAMQRRLGGIRWRKLHRLAYVVALTATVHYLWSVKKDRTRPLVYAGIFAVLLASRPVMRRLRESGVPRGT
jgi:methionine sulfoxide reductase heme-binding subunit